ncbi:lipoprotein [Photobacterium leiognathi]|nr:lipoprotein [Photobacterium leiognathi]
MKKLILPLMVTALLAGCNETATAVNNKDFSPEQKAQIEKIASQ